MPHDESSDERQRVEVEVASRLRSRGVHLTGRETSDELVGLLDAVERFERAVERHGGDLMVDEPIGRARTAEPDNPGFVLPARGEGESVRGYLGRIAEATQRAAARRP
jgi:hypothetical protein